MSEIGDGVLDDRRFAAQEVEVAALVRLEHVVHVQPSVSALVVALGRLPARAPSPRARPSIDQRGRGARSGTSSRIRSPSWTSASGPPTADSGATCRTTAPYDVPLMRASEIRTMSLTPCSEQLRRDRQVPPLGHPGRADRPGVAQHHHARRVARRGRGRRRARRGRGCPRRRPPRPSCCEQARIGGGDLHHRAVRAEVAAQDDERAACVERVVARSG